MYVSALSYGGVHMRTNHKGQVILRFVPHCAIAGKRINKNNKSSLEIEACRTQEI